MDDRAETSVGSAAAQHTAGYGVYLKVWIALAIVTVLMVEIHHPALLIAGIAVKALLIMLYFMHLKYERLDFVLYILVGTFATAFVLFGLIVPDGLRM